MQPRITHPSDSVPSVSVPPIDVVPVVVPPSVVSVVDGVPVELALELDVVVDVVVAVVAVVAVSEPAGTRQPATRRPVHRKRRRPVVDEVT